MAWVVKAWKPDAYAARLASLEELAGELREDVRRHRDASREEIKVRKGRATMRDSPLGELFRATGDDRSRCVVAASGLVRARAGRP